MKTLICNCNRSMPLDPAALTQALTPPPSALPAPKGWSPAPQGSPSADTVEAGFTTLCRREAPAFQRAARSGEPLLVACTQESRLFLELAEQTEGAPALQERPIRFVNIRETAGWSRDAGEATPKIAALIAAARLPDAEPVASVSYRSEGRCLVIGPADAAEAAARLLEPDLTVSVLATAGAGALAQRHERAVHNGSLQRLTGHLGAFEVTWRSANPIDLDLCTRCNACIDVCPEGAIDFSYTVDLTRCRSHRACVVACEAAGAIDFQRPPQDTTERFDLVLDLRETPAFTQHQPPQGYLHVGSDALKLAQAAITLRGWVGEFEKPRFFHYKAKLCAHSRNEQIGCTACIDVCSARAIRSDASLKGKAERKLRTTTQAVPVAGGQGGGIVVDPHLCVGCGACTTVCPTGALGYAAPDTVDQGRRIRTLLQAFQKAGGRQPALLVHSEGAGRRLIEDLGRAARVDRSLQGVPARVLPMAVWHTASIGLDLWLTAIAQGANQIWVLLTDEEAPEYREALANQMAIGEAILQGLGFGGMHLRTLHARDARDLAALDAALRAQPAQGVARPAAVAAQAEKRSTLELALDALLVAAPERPASIALPAGAPLGSLIVDAQKCTLCLSCVGACPQAALADNPNQPQLRFIEKNCVQCGLCVKTCPEDALTLQPRLWLEDEGKARKQLRVLNEAEPFHCVSCGKPFGTLRAIEAMVAKIGQHPAFAGANAQRLKMCGDCRVNAMFSNPNETRITDL
ncbi:MAG: 4Fe-4S binding protein [Rubrivivax sp.]|nr:4Fe-4S binding protein [Rubrivivax sp.]